MNDRDSEFRQQAARPYARNLQQLRRIGRAGAEDDLAARAYFANCPGVALRIANAARPLPLEQDRRRLRTGADIQVRRLPDRPQEGARRAHPPAVPDVTLIVAHARLDRAIVIAVAWKAEAMRRVDKSVAERVAPVAVRDGQLPLSSTISGVAGSDPPFGSLEVRQDVGITPASIA